MFKNTKILIGAAILIAAVAASSFAYWYKMHGGDIVSNWITQNGLKTETSQMGNGMALYDVQGACRADGVLLGNENQDCGSRVRITGVDTDGKVQIGFYLPRGNMALTGVPIMQKGELIVGIEVLNFVSKGGEDHPMPASGSCVGASSGQIFECTVNVGGYEKAFHATLAKPT